MLFCTQHHQSGGRKAQNCNSHAAAVDFFSACASSCNQHIASLSLRNKYKNAGLRDAKCINCAHTEQKAEAATHSLTRSSFCYWTLGRILIQHTHIQHRMTFRMLPGAFQRETEKSGRAGAEKVQPKKWLRGISWPGLFSVHAPAPTMG